MTYSHYQSNPNGWGTNKFQFSHPTRTQFQPHASWGGIDYFRAHAPNIDPTIFNHVYSNISGACASLGVGFAEARIWHQRVYGGLVAIHVLTPQEIGYASAYEAYRMWIHNNTLYEPLGEESERQREAFVGLAIAEATRMYMASRPADVYGYMPACDAAGATALLIFDQNLVDGVGGYLGGSPYRSGAEFGTPGTGMAGGIDPYAIDHEAPYHRQRTGRNRLLSMPSPSGTYSPGRGGVGMGGSPYLGAGGGMSMGASPLPGGNGTRGTMMHGSAYPAYGAYGSPGASLLDVPSHMYGGTPAYNETGNVTRVSTYPGTTTIITLPRRRHGSSTSRHHDRHHKRARSAEPVNTANTSTYSGGMGMGAPAGFVGGAGTRCDGRLHREV